jgi:hypothetical protein
MVSPKQSSLPNIKTRQTANSVDDEVEPQLVCTERELSLNIEDEIKNGFFELKQKFSDSGPSSIYISHIILHQKHPIFLKCEMETLKRLLVESSVVYLSKD